MRVVNGILEDVTNHDLIDGIFTVPNKVTIINNNSFKKCNLLETLILPANLKYIEKDSIPFHINKILTPWGEIENIKSKDIIIDYMYLYANSILKIKYKNQEEFINDTRINQIIKLSNNNEKIINNFKKLFYKLRKQYNLEPQVVNVLSKDQVEKFDLKLWKQIFPIFCSKINDKHSLKMYSIYSEIIDVFGLFELDENKGKRIQNYKRFINNRPFILTKEEYSKINIEGYNNEEIFKEEPVKTYILKDDIEIPDNFKIYLKDKLTQEEVKKIKRLTGTYGNEINVFIKKKYIINNDIRYQLDPEYYEDKKLTDILFYEYETSNINYHSLCRIFNGCRKEFDEDFYNFFIDNLVLILKNKQIQNKVKNIQRNFKEIKKYYLKTSGVNQITLKQAIDFLDNKQFTYHDGNYELAQEVKKAGIVSQEAFEYYQKIYEENNIRKLRSLVKRSNVFEIDGYKIKAELLRKDDSFAMLIGEANYTNCCQIFGGIGHNCMAHAANSDDGGIFVIKLLKDNEEILLAQSWDWQNNNVDCHENIEITNYLKEHDNLKKIVAKAYELDAKYIMKISKQEVEKYIKKRKMIIKKSLSPNKKNELKELKELEQREVIRVVTVGLANEKLGISKFFKTSIDVNKEQIINGIKYTLQDFQPVNYDQNQPYFNKDRTDYTDSFVTQYIIAGSIEKLCLGKLEPLVPIYRDERKILLETKKEIRNFTTKKVKDIEINNNFENVIDYEKYNLIDYKKSNVFLGEDWYLIYEEIDDNTIKINNLAKIKPTLDDEKTVQNKEIINTIYNLLKKYERIEVNLRESNSYLLFLLNKKLGYIEQIGNDISYDYNDSTNIKIISDKEQDMILNNIKLIKNNKNHDQIIHQITFKKGPKLTINDQKIKKI